MDWLPFPAPDTAMGLFETVADAYSQVLELVSVLL